MAFGYDPTFENENDAFKIIYDNTDINHDIKELIDFCISDSKESQSFYSNYRFQTEAYLKKLKSRKENQQKIK